MATGLQATVILPNRAIDLGPYISDANWTTNALGGFGSASFTLPGNPSAWIPKTPKLSLVRLSQDGVLLFEGQIEDHEYSVSDGEMSTTVQCFGLARLLSEVSVRRLWHKRDSEFTQGQLSLWTPDPAFGVQTGNFLPTDLTKSGIRFTGNGGTTVTTKKTYYRISAPPGLTFVAAHGAYQKAGNASLFAEIWSSTDFATYVNHLSTAANTTGTFDITTTPNAVDVLFGVTSSGAFVSAATDFAQFYGVGVQTVAPTAATEFSGVGDAYAVYGGWVLRDLISLVPGLTLGMIDAGSEFGVEAIERAVRSAALDVVQEVAAYYSKEWGVYENGRTDWKEINLDEIHWIVDVGDLQSLNLRSSVDELSSREIVLYTDAASGLDKEASASSTSRANPYVVRGRNKDNITSPGFPMTTNTSAQLTAKLLAARGGAPFASGTCQLAYRTPVTVAGGGQKPAYAIRAGQNIKIPGLPKTNPFDTGRDGETLFHIVSTSGSLDGSVTLTLDSQDQAIDALLARLASVTRTLTG